MSYQLRDWEEKEALHVESDIWRSKFLASTLILEEVSRTKQNNEARCQQLEHASRYKKCSDEKVNLSPFFD